MTVIFEDPDSVVTDDRYPGWRARIVYDEYAGEPDGDALAPALVIVTRRQPYLAKGVYMPQSADEILAAWQRLEDRDLFERYLRMFHGATTIAAASNRDLDVLVFDTADFHRHVGIRDLPADVSGERDEWQAWLDGEVYGVVVERHHAGTITWDDGTTTATGQWRDVESVWGIYGHTYAAQEAADMLDGCASA